MTYRVRLSRDNARPRLGYFQEGHDATEFRACDQATVYASAALAELRAAMINEFTDTHGVTAELETVDDDGPGPMACPACGKAVAQFGDAPSLAAALERVLRHYAPQALDGEPWTLSGNSQTDSVLRVARAALDAHRARFNTPMPEGP